MQTALLMLAMFYANFTERNVPIALDAMTRDYFPSKSNLHVFRWDHEQKQIVLSSFFWGFVVSSIPGAILSKKFGSKIMLFVTIFGSSVLSLVTPIVVIKGEWLAFCGVRVVQGLFHGMVTPIVIEHITKWSPQSEMTLHTALSISGVDLGIITAIGLGELIGGSSLGWPAISYTSGVIGFFWCLLWVVFGGTSPRQAALVSPIEREIIVINQRVDHHPNKKITIPWKAMFTSIPFYALLTTTCAQVWCHSAVANESKALFNATNTFLTALPHIASWIMLLVYLAIGHTILKKGILSLGHLRKIFNSYGMLLPAAVLIGLAFINDTHTTTGVILVTVLSGVNVGVVIGSGINLVDIAPNFASVIMGIILVVNSTIKFVTPLAVGYDQVSVLCVTLKQSPN